MQARPRPGHIHFCKPRSGLAMDSTAELGFRMDLPVVVQRMCTSLESLLSLFDGKYQCCVDGHMRYIL